VKHSKHKLSGTPGERIFTDIASIRPVEGVKVNKPRWCIKVDETTQLKFSSFHAHKDEMVEPSCEMFYRWRQDGHPVKYVRCDNAGENKTLQKRANGSDWKLNIVFEFTPRDTPQHNHLAELGLASIANKGRTLMSAANIPMNVRYKVWVKAFQHATDLDGLIIVDVNGKTASRYEHWTGQLPKWIGQLRTWGESGTVKIKTDTTPKIADRGIQCVFVGYSKDHDGDCFEMWYPKTNRIYTSQDVIWLNRMHYTKTVEEGEPDSQLLRNELTGTPVEQAFQDDDEDIEPIADALTNVQSTNDHEEEVAEEGPAADLVTNSGVTMSGSRFRDVAAANNAHFPVQLSKAEENYSHYMKSCPEIACVGAGIGGGFEDTTELHTMKYDEAMSSEEAEQWKKSVEKEYQRMEENKVWSPIDKAKLPTGAKILTSTWAMKKKADGKYRARLNCRGFEQVPGVHYKQNTIAAPVVALMTIRITLAIMIMAGWTGQILDVRGAFLKGNFSDGEELYLYVPQGMEKWYGTGVYLVLHKALYGLKQAAYRFWVYLLTIVHCLKYSRSKADPCLYYKWTDKGALLLWLSWVDDCFLTGPTAELLQSKEDIMSRIDCEDGGEVKEFVGCKIDYDRKNKSMKLTQPVLLQSFKDEFNITMGSDLPRTPGIPQKTLQLGSAPPVEGTRNTYYRSGVGKLMHLKRWSRPEMTNALRDLSRYNSSCTEEHIEAMHRVMRYATTTPSRGLQLAPKGNWDGNPEFEFSVTGYADASFKPYLDTAASVGGHAVFLNDSPIAEKSKLQQSTTLSVTEAELTSGIDCAQDMLFAMRVLESIGLRVNKPMMLTIDNKGAVNYANNWSTGGRMRHSVIKLSFLRELKEAGLIEVNWCKSEEMPADLFTKNLSTSQFHTHTTTFCGEDEYG
jgi:hypothetical protein